MKCVRKDCDNWCAGVICRTCESKDLKLRSQSADTKYMTNTDTVQPFPTDRRGYRATSEDRARWELNEWKRVRELYCPKRPLKS